MNIKRKKYCWLVSHTSLRLQRHSAKIKLRIASSSCLDARIIRLAQTRSQEPNVPGTPCIKHEITYVFKLFAFHGGCGLLIESPRHSVTRPTLRIRHACMVNTAMYTLVYEHSKKRDQERMVMTAGPCSDPLWLDVMIFGLSQVNS